MFEVNYFKELITQQTWFKRITMIETFNCTIRGSIYDKNNDQPQQWNEFVLLYIIYFIESLLKKWTTVLLDIIVFQK